MNTIKFEKVCRTCMQEKPEMIQLFGDVLYSQVLTTCCGLDVSYYCGNDLFLYLLKL